MLQQGSHILDTDDPDSLGQGLQGEDKVPQVRLRLTPMDPEALRTNMSMGAKIYKPTSSRPSGVADGNFELVRANTEQADLVHSKLRQSSRSSAKHLPVHHPT